MLLIVLFVELINTIVLLLFFKVLLNIIVLFAFTIFIPLELKVVLFIKVLLVLINNMSSPWVNVPSLFMD